MGSPSLLYLIDGYNLLFRSSRGIEASLREEREQFINDLTELIEKAGINAFFVFDAAYYEGDRHLTKKGHVEIHFTKPGQIADDFLVDWVVRSKTPSLCVIVTSDRVLAVRCRELKAQVIGIDAFLKRLRKIKKTPKPPPPISTPLPRKKLSLEEYYLQSFGHIEAPSENLQKKKPLKKKKAAFSQNDFQRWMDIFSEKEGGSEN